MARIIDWKRSEDPRDAVHVAVQALVEGRLVVLPTETTYEVAASGLRPAAVAQLVQHVVGPSGIRPGLLVRSRDEAMDYVCDLSPVADRLARRSWPGPVALELRGDCPSGLVRQLASEVRSVILDKDAQVNIRVAAHDAVAHILQLCPGPLISVPLLSSHATANSNGAEPFTSNQATNAGGNGDSGHNGYGPVTDQVAAHCESLDLLVLDDGPTHFKQLPSLVRVDGNHCNLMRNGAVDRQGLLSLGQMVILLVCTGNTCRSPMAQTLLCAKLKERFGDAATPSVTAISAGLSAASGGAASPEAVEVMKSLGLSLRNHQSRPVNGRLLEHADLILVMTRAHRQAMLSRWPHVAGKVHLLDPRGGDVSDPFGGSLEIYETCAGQMTHFLDHWAETLTEDGFPVWQ